MKIIELFQKPNIHKYFYFIAKPFLTEDEFKKTEEVVRAFGDGIGLKLHRKLQEKARTSKNWVRVMFSVI